MSDEKDLFGLAPEQAGESVVAPHVDPEADGVDVGFDPNTFINPLTGEVVDIADTDGLIEQYEKLKDQNDRIYSALIRIRESLAAKSIDNGKKTRRVRGKTRCVVIKMPDDSWSQSMLKAAWTRFPQFRESVLKIDSVGVQLREFAKLIGTNGDEEFNEFRNLVAKANNGPTGTPSITVET